MEEILNALKRDEKAKVVRKKGLIPGVIYGKDIKTTEVSFDKGQLVKILKQKGEKSKIRFNLDGKKYYGIIKELARDIATAEMLHIDIQSVDMGEKVRWSIPIAFSGKEKLKNKGLYIQVYASEIEVQGDAGKIPDSIVLDASNNDYGDELKFKDIKLDSCIELLDDPEKLVAVITNA